MILVDEGGVTVPRTRAEALRYKLNDQKMWVKQQLMIKKITQEELAKKLGTSQENVSNKLKLDDGESYKGGKHKCGHLDVKDLLVLIDIVKPSPEEIIKLMSI